MLLLLVGGGGRDIDEELWGEESGVLVGGEDSRLPESGGCGLEATIGELLGV